MTKGVWANQFHPWFTPEALVPYLLGKEQGCVSFLSVLHSTGALSQIPQKIQLATTGHSRQLMSPVGRFEFIQMKPELINIGCEWSNTKLPYLHSTIEKALFDCLYISTRKLNRFSRMPELDLQESGFNEELFYGVLEEVRIPERIKSAIRAAYENRKRSA